ncbi:hypothetical protein MKFW12EY_00290 [Methylomonas koyamae]|nr:hypothetical protein MKFW12EY_00290 [Methylomonas koyamae]
MAGCREINLPKLALTTAKNPHKQPARMAGTVSKPSSLTAVGRNFPLDASRLAGSFYSVSIP